MQEVDHQCKNRESSDVTCRTPTRHRSPQRIARTRCPPSWSSCLKRFTRALCLRTFVQTLEKTWLDGKRRPKLQQLLFHSLVQLCRSADSTHHKHDLEIGLETKILQKHLFMMPMRVAVDIGEKTLTAASTDLFDESAFLLNDEILQPLRVGCGDLLAANKILWTIQDPSGRCKRWCTSFLAPALAAENFRSATRASGSQSWLI